MTQYTHSKVYKDSHTTAISDKYRDQVQPKLSPKKHNIY